MAPEASGAVRRTVEFDPAKLDRDAVRVVEKLREAGYTSYLVGGCVRDLLAGLSPKDFDVSTDARPRQVRKVFRNARIIGRRFRLVHVRFGEKIIETATFRRNPREDEEPPADDDEVLLREDNVFGTPEEDANRRDFTINGLFYDPEAHEVIDYVGGLADMERKIVRTIDDPWLRFREDPVRLVRGAKYAAKLDFDFDPDTWAAMCELKAEITKAAPARLLEEIFKIGRSGDSADSWKILLESGVLEHWMPGVVEALQAPAPKAQDGSAGPSASDLFFGRCRRLDADPNGREQLGNAMFLVPLYHLLLAPYLPSNPVNERRLQGLVEDIVRPFALAFRVSRRDSTWARHICWAQRRMEGWGRDTVPARRFVRFDYFQGALTYLAWRAEARPPTPPQRPQAHPRPRRRRKQARRRRRPQARAVARATAEGKLDCPNGRLPGGHI
ncbi:MAG: polynucleotide adenylyltransferase PcnB [Planctomycetota bacterium]|jgi:poly(A) polymerase